MSRAVYPVVAEVIEHEGEHPHPGVARIPSEQTKLCDENRVHEHAERTAHDVDELTHESGIKRGDGVLETIKIASTPPTR